MGCVKHGTRVSKRCRCSRVSAGECLFYHGFDPMGWGLSIHSGAHGCHDVPVVEVDQKALDIGPLATQFGFYRMNRTYLIPEHAMTINLLSQNRSASRQAAEFFHKPVWVDTDMD